MKDQNISRLEIFCVDALVMPIKRMLLGMKGVHRINDQPVVNAVAQNGTVKARTSGKLIDLLHAYLRQHKIKTVTSDTLREFQRSIGRSPSAYSNAQQVGVNAGLLISNKAKNKNQRAYTVDLSAV